MKTNQRIIGLMLLVATAAVVVLTVKRGLGEFGRLFDGMDPQTGIVLGVGSVVLLLGLTLVAAAIRLASCREIDIWRRSERARIYQAVLESVTKSTFAATLQSQTLPLARSLFLIGSPSVINDYWTLQAMFSSKHTAPTPLKNQIIHLMLAMRRDMGESTLGLANTDWAEWVIPETAEIPTPEDRRPSDLLVSLDRAATPAHRL